MMSDGGSEMLRSPATKRDPDACEDTRELTSRHTLILQGQLAKAGPMLDEIIRSAGQFAYQPRHRL
jgi:hypothetical protein